MLDQLFCLHDELLALHRLPDVLAIPLPVLVVDYVDQLVLLGPAFREFDLVVSY